MWEYMYRSQLPEMRKIIETFEKTIGFLEQLPKKKENEILKGRALNRLAFHYSGYALRGGDSWCRAADSQVKAQENIDKAIKIFEDVGSWL